MTQVSGLVVVLSADPQEAERAVGRLGQELDLELGSISASRRLAVVLEAESGQASEARLRSIESVPGVARVEVVFVGFEPPARSKPNQVTP